MSNKVKKVNLAEPGPSCTVPQNGETSGLCNGKEEEANRQWKGLVFSYHIFLHTFHTFPAKKKDILSFQQQTD